MPFSLLRRRVLRSFAPPRALALSLALTLPLALAALPAAAQPTFNKTFFPETSGPSTVSTLVFEINNGGGTPVEELAFTDNLPAGLLVADPVYVTNSCDGTVTAAAGGGTISLANGELGAFSSCQIQVDVAGAAQANSDTTYMNVSGDLTSDQGNSGTATDDLTVDVDRPGFDKTFASDMLRLGETTTLTFTVDNSLNGANTFNLRFSDTLPSGLRVASPANASTTCGGGVITASPGSQLISYDPVFGGDATVASGATCTVSVDVTAVAVGTFINRSGELTSSSPFFTSSGIATDDVTVTVDELALVKEFVDDPVAPGGTVTLEFRLTNLNRSESATNLAFTDDLDATLSGLTATDTPQSDVCGAGSQISGTSLLSFTGGTLAPGESCTIQVTLAVPAGATPGDYPNTTSDVSGDVGGTPTTGAGASDTLAVQEVPILTKTFLTDPVAAGDTVTAEFTIQNSSSTNSASGIDFDDNLSQFLSGVTVSSLPAAGFCGGGSFAFVASIGGEDVLNVTNASLAAGADCTFQVDFVIPQGASGLYTNNTSPVTATVGGEPVVGDAASDDLTVIPAVRISKTFEDDPVSPGSTVDLLFTLSLDDAAPGDATGVSFTDDLDAALAGLTAVSPVFPVADPCGAGSSLTLDAGTQVLTLSGGTLAPDTSCQFTVTLQVPAAADPGDYPNSTSAPTATVDGTPTTGVAATDDLTVAAVDFSKEFVNDPTFAGDQVTLRFSLENLSATEAATDVAFTDDLGATLDGLTPVVVPSTPCSGNLTAAGPDSDVLVFQNGSLAAGASCSFDVTVQVPSDADPGDYVNTTSNLTFTYDGATVVQDPVQDILTVVEPLFFSKQFQGDPVAPGDTVTLQFTIDNLDADDTATGLAFTDDLDAALTGLQATDTPIADPCGAGSSLSGTDTLVLTGGTVAPGSSCTFSVTLQVPANPDTSVPAINQTSDLTGSVGGVAVTADPAADELELLVIDLQKTFDGPTAATNTVVLTFTLSNQSSTDTFENLGFTDDLDAVLPGLVALDTPQSDVCGEGSQVTGTSFLSFSGGILGPGESCSFDVTLQVPADALPGLYPNTTSTVREEGLPAGVPGSDDLQVEPPPTFAKVFDPGLVMPGQPSTLTFTIDNSASAIPADDLAFSDNLPAGLVVATPANTANTCGGTFTATSGGGTLSLSGGTVGSGATCTLEVDVVASAVGRYENTAGELTSSSGSSGTAADNLDVETGLALSKTFGFPAVRGELVDLTFVIDNGLAVEATAITFSDDLDAALSGLAAEGLPMNDVCGTGSQVSGTSTVTLTGGNLPSGASCSFTVAVRLPADAPDGTFVNTTSVISADREGTTVSGDPASDSFTVEPAPAFGKEFVPAVISPGATSRLTFTIDNTASVAATGLAFTDTLPAGLTIQAVPGATNGCGGTLTAPPGGTTIELTAGSVAAGASCSVAVDVTSGDTGRYENVSSELSSSLGTSPPAEDTLDVATDLAFVKEFDDPTLRGGLVDLTFTISNGLASQVTGLTFSDDLSAALAGLQSESGTLTDVCGAGSQISGTSLLTFSGGSLASGESCTVTVQVRVPGDAPTGSYTNTTGELTGTQDAMTVSGGQATDSLEVLFLGFSKEFDRDRAGAGSIVGLRFTLSNPDPERTASDVTFVDDLDAFLPGATAVDLLQSDVCGAGSTLSGTSVVTLAGGVLGPGDTCDFTVRVRLPAENFGSTFVNTTTPLSATVDGVPTEGAPEEAAEASLVIAAPIPTLSEWMMILLAMMLGLFGVRRLRP